MNQKEKTEKTKERILQAAMEEFGANGYAGATLNNICKTGISKGLLYHNFSSKNELYLLCIHRSITKLTAYLKQQNLDSDLETYMKARLCFFQNHPLEARLFFEATLQPPPALKNQIAEQRKEIDAFNVDLYKKAIAKVSLRPGITEKDAVAYFRFLQDMFNGYFSSPACRDMSLFEKITVHENNLSKLFEYMIYGIAEKREKI